MPGSAEPLPIVLLPGLNGDARVFAPQRAALPAATVVGWTPPRPADDLPQYARRLAILHDLRGPCVIVGVSFGGVVAIEMARHVGALCCVVVASSRDPSGLPLPLRVLRPVAAVVPAAVVGSALRFAWSTAQVVAPGGRGRTPRSRVEFQRWAVAALLRWRPAGPPPCPLVQVHGDRDRTFPAGAARADHVIRGGGHLLMLTHADEVNAILTAIVRRHAA